jgi:hypothetical protein
MNWKLRGRSLSWPNVSWCPGICLEELRKATKHLGIVGFRTEFRSGHLRNTRQYAATWSNFPVFYMITSPIAVCAMRANGIKKSLTTVYVATFSRSRQANGLEEHIFRDIHCKLFPTTCNFCVSSPTFPQRTEAHLSCCLYNPIQI